MIDTISINKIINYLILGTVFFIPISNGLTNTLGIAVIALWIFEGKFREKLQLIQKADYYLLFFWSLILFTGISFLWSDSIYDGFWRSHYQNGVFYYFQYFITYTLLGLIVYTSFEKQNISKAIYLFILAMFISEIIFYGNYFEVWHIYQIKNTSFGSPFLHHSEYSTFITIAFFFFLNYYISYILPSDKHIFFKFLSSLMLLGILVNLFLNGGRIGQITLFITMLFFIFHRYSITWKTTLLAFLINLIILSSAYLLSPTVQTRVTQAKHDIENILKHNFNSPWGYRYAYILMGIEAADTPQSFLIGHGFGDAKTIILSDERMQEFHLDTDGRELSMIPHLHNQFIQNFVETGIIGVLLLTLTFSFFYFTRFKEKDIQVYSKVFLVPLLLSTVATSTFLSDASFILWCIFISMFALQEKKGKPLIERE